MIDAIEGELSGKARDRPKRPVVVQGYGPELLGEGKGFHTISIFPPSPSLKSLVLLHSG